MARCSPHLLQGHEPPNRHYRQMRQAPVGLTNHDLRPTFPYMKRQGIGTRETTSGGHVDSRLEKSATPGLSNSPRRRLPHEYGGGKQTVNRIMMRPWRPSREGVTASPVIFLLPLAVGAMAMATDLGYAVLVRSQLQVAADSAVAGAALRLGTSREYAVQAAKSAARGRMASGRSVVVNDGDVQLGLWNTDARTFTPSASGGNAVRVVARRDEPEGSLRPPFLARLISTTAPHVSASAVAVAAPRDIAFVVDLSGSMNDGTQSCRGARLGQAENSPQESSKLKTAKLQRIFDDFGFGAYPGELEHIGRFAHLPDGPFAYAQLTENAGPMTGPDVPPQYRIQDTDGEPTRKRKCYSALIDLQISALMPAAKPIPDSSINYEYWEKYLDYVIHPVKVTHPVNRGWLPPHQDRDRICRSDAYSTTGTSDSTHGKDSACFGNKIGYRTYLQFMLDFGRDLKPNGRQYVPLSGHSPHCPWRPETTAEGRFDFPPRTEPMHSVRRALIAALQTVKQRNLKIGNPALADRVSIISFDSLAGGGPVVRQPLTTDLDLAMRACSRLQAVGDRGATSAMDSGMEMARRHLRPKKEGGQGRRAAKKVVVLLAAGPPDTCATDRSKIDRFVHVHPAQEFYPDGAYRFNAPLVSAARMHARGWRVYPIAIGTRNHHGFLDRLALVGGTGESRDQTVPASTETMDSKRQLVDVLTRIVSATEVQLVQ
jgi:putative Tad-like protein involved in Flp pilus assembly